MAPNDLISKIRLIEVNAFVKHVNFYETDFRYSNCPRRNFEIKSTKSGTDSLSFSWNHVEEISMGCEGSIAVIIKI